ncbi:hypothetical protein V6N12_065274 [Hibiscus sabdariffa]|uniref:Uncharacterized protein n=1 Tax=Hibiscus sabdariffa TaxID=183260 RepID=A0ABR2G967_9ROSI
MTHEPHWLLDWYWNNVSGENVSHRICDYLKGRCKLRIAGDLHHYMRHSYVPSEGPIHVQRLLANGCGGALLHLIHVFGNFSQFYGKTYECKSAYPSFDDSSRRKLDHILEDESFSDILMSFFGTVWNSFVYVLEHSFVSLVGVVLLLIAVIAFVVSMLAHKKRAIIGVLYVSAHLSAALILMLLLELGLETCIQHNFLATSGYHTLYRWYQSVESEHFPDPTGLREQIDRTMDIRPLSNINICKNGIQSLSREGAIIYYASVFLYFWVFFTHVVSLVFRSYLYICINWLHIHFDEAFSSLRIANYKLFTWFHINPNGDLEVFTLAIDKVPKEWRLDPDWDAEAKKASKVESPEKISSKWSASAGQQDPVNTVKIVDQFISRQTEKHDFASSNGSISC